MEVYRSVSSGTDCAAHGRKVVCSNPAAATKKPLAFLHVPRLFSRSSKNGEHWTALAASMSNALAGCLQWLRSAGLPVSLRGRVRSQVFESFAANLRLRPVVAKAVQHSMEEGFGRDVWDRIPRRTLEMSLPSPTLIIHDVDDDMVPIEEAKTIFRHRGVVLVTTYGHGHNGVLRASEVIDQIVTLAPAERVST